MASEDADPVVWPPSGEVVPYLLQEQSQHTDNLNVHFDNSCSEALAFHTAFPITIGHSRLVLKLY